MCLLKRPFVLASIQGKAVAMIDSKAFHSLTCGMYIIGTQGADGRAGCTVNTFTQVASQPARATVAINKDNRTAQTICESGCYTASVLDEGAPLDLISLFGFRSSTEIDKFAQVGFATDANGIPYVTDHACARFSVRVDRIEDAGTHLLFLGTVEQAETLSVEAPMTYALYHQVKGGKTPPRASTYDPNEDFGQAVPAGFTGTVAWRCRVCGHIEYAEELPEGYVCPVCGALRDMFECIEVQG
jgi:flavin reductase (DIM6/NTAB) family NADH-FMN oxidoreductase RutF/rubredoxin